MSRNEQSFISQLNKFQTLISLLDKAGMKKKDIAKYLGIYPSAYSSLTNVVIIKALDNKTDINEKQRIKTAFAEVNNVSEKRIRQELPNYIRKLEMLHEETLSTLSARESTYVEELLHATPSKIAEKLIGIYDCFYISSFGYRIKKEPFMIRPSKTNHSYHVLKGNDQSPACFKGFLYMSNTHVFTVQLQEIGTINPDNFIVHFVLPPSYSESLHFLKGLSVSMSNSYFPISRKILLKKVSTDINMEKYHQRPTRWYERDEIKQLSDIGLYLSQTNALIEYIPIPQPAFDERDLKKELEINKILKA